MPTDEERIDGLEADAVRSNQRINKLDAEAVLRHEHLVELLDEVASLTKAMAHRSMIDQAKGMVMATNGCGPQAAFAILVARADAENRKLWEIATELVAAQEHRTFQPNHQWTPHPRRT